MNKEKEEMLERLRNVKQTAENDLKEKQGYESYTVKNVIHYNKKVELVNKETKEKEEFDLCVVLAENPDTKEITEFYYLEEKEVDFTELLKKYESPKPIKEVLDKTKENEEKHEEEQDKELKRDSLEELEVEKVKEEKGVSKEKEKIEESKNDLTGQKPKYVIQTIDIDKAYIDNWTTVRRGFDLPEGVEKIAIAAPNQKDDNILSSNMTMYMLDNRGNIIENVNGKTIEDYFEIDDATGCNPMYDDNIKLELDGYAEKNKGQTMRRFKSKENPDLYLSAEQKKIGDYVEVYAGRKTKDGNDAVEVQLETDNVGIQTSLEMQEIISGYRGWDNADNIKDEADIHEAHGDDEMKISKENADGERSTIEICDSDIIPGTDKTWEELSEETGEGIKKLQERFEREFEDGKKPEEIVEEIEYDYEMVGHNRERM